MHIVAMLLPADEFSYLYFWQNILIFICDFHLNILLMVLKIFSLASSKIPHRPKNSIYIKVIPAQALLLPFKPFIFLYPIYCVWKYIVLHTYLFNLWTT